MNINELIQEVTKYCEDLSNVKSAEKEMVEEDELMKTDRVEVERESEEEKQVE